MENKFIIFVVFASLAQGSIVLSSTVIDYGLSEDQLTSLDEIIVNEAAALQAKYAAFDPIFDTIGKYASALIWNVEAGSDDDSPKTAEALVSAKDSIDYSLSPISVFSEESCDAVEVARNAVYADLDNIYAVIAEALTLGLSENGSANQPQLEEYRNAAQENMANLVTSVFDSFRTCLATTNEDTLDVIQADQNGSGQALVHVVDAVFNAIKLLAAAVTAGTADASLISKIEDYRRYAHIGLRADVQHKFGAYKAVYISVQLDQSKIVSLLASSLNAATGASYSYKAGTDAVWSAINDGLEKISLGLHDAGDADFSAIDVAQATATAGFKAGDHMLLALVQSELPDASSVAAAEETLFTESTNLVALYFEAIKTALDQDLNSSNSFDIIEGSWNSAMSEVKAAGDGFYAILRGSGTWDDEKEVEFATLRAAGDEQLGSFTDAVYYSIFTLRRAVDNGSASVGDVNTIKSFAEVAVTAVYSFAQSVAAAVLVAHEAAKAN